MWEALFGQAIVLLSMGTLVYSAVRVRRNRIQIWKDAARLDLELRRAARQAIAEIQSRAEDASPGQLSLAGTEAGQLSLAHDPAGQLSLPPGERPE